MLSAGREVRDADGEVHGVTEHELKWGKKAKNIPTLSRVRVRERDKERCFRCGSPTKAGQWHHRRSRGVIAPHRHCPCNGVWLCPTCHRQVHANPEESRLEGLIVSRNEENPCNVPVLSWYGVLLLDCGGHVTHFTGVVDAREF